MIDWSCHVSQHRVSVLDVLHLKTNKSLDEPFWTSFTDYREKLGLVSLTLYTNRPSTDFGLGTLRWTFEMFQVLFEFEIKFPEEWWAFC
jgi:hypothetical protein